MLAASEIRYDVSLFLGHNVDFHMNRHAFTFNATLTSFFRCFIQQVSLPWQIDAISFTTQRKAANAFATIFAVIKIKPNYWVAFIISGTQKYIKVKPAWSIIENKNQTIFFRIKEENQNYCNCALSIHVTCILLLQHLEEHIFILHYLVH